MVAVAFVASAGVVAGTTKRVGTDSKRVVLAGVDVAGQEMVSEALPAKVGLRFLRKISIPELDVEARRPGSLGKDLVLRWPACPTTRFD